MISPLFARLKGYARIAVEGDPQRFFRRALGHGFALWRLCWRPGRLEAEVPLAALPMLQEEASRLGARLTVLARGGWPFWWSRLRGRPAFLAAGVAAVLAYALLANLVWQVRVVGAEGELAARLKAEAAALGLRPGVLRALVPTAAVAARLRRVPGVLWVGVSFYGVDAYVQVAKELPPPKPPPTRVGEDLVASRSGIVTRVVVFQGTAAVQPGDTVAAGQVLIRGGEPHAADRAGAAFAEGEVWARTFVSVEGKADLSGTEEVPTGRRRFVVSVAWQGTQVLAGGLPLARFAHARLRRQIWELPLVPLALQVAELTEVRRRTVALEPAAVRRRLAERLAAEARRHLGPGARWLQRRETFRITNGSMVGTLAVAAEVDIAVPGGRSPGR